MIRLYLAGLLFTYINIGFTKTVWNLDQMKDKPIPVHLKIGKVSVIRLDVNPKKIMIGNPSHFDVQVYGQDIALRPRAYIHSNMFIYSNLGLINFRLLCDEELERFDDLLLVQSKHKSVKNFKIASRSLGHRLNLNFKKLRRFPKKNMYVLDFKIKNLKSRTVHTKKIKVKFKRFNKHLKLKHTLKFSKATLKKNEETNGRLQFYLNDKQRLSVIFHFKAKQLSIIMNKGSL